jgi:hypothetical protein
MMEMPLSLRGNERIKACLAELQAEAARANEISVASLLASLKTAAKRATSLDQIAERRQSYSSKGPNRSISEQRIRGHSLPEEFDRADSIDAMAHHFDVELTESQRVEFSGLLRDWWDVYCRSPSRQGRRSRSA